MLLEPAQLLARAQLMLPPPPAFPDGPPEGTALL
jgi:hypothetical protein